ncbi:hypothetical protein ES707_14478 [subsurface metagenome]
MEKEILWFGKELIMKSKIYLLCVAFMTISLFSSSALGLDPMGPPTAGLKTGQARIGFEYVYAEADIEGTYAGISDTFDDVESNRLMSNLGYGLTDDWEVFLRLGVTDVEQDGFESDYEFAYGFGTKVTFAKDDNLSWGALFQMGWSEVEDSVTYNLTDFGLGIVTVDEEVDWYEIQIAVGPTYELREGWLIYGGALVYFLEGEVDFAGVATIDLEEESQFGGYIGTQVDLDENASWFVEYQLTGDAYAVGTGISWKF